MISQPETHTHNRADICNRRCHRMGAVNLYFWKISFDLDREIREEMKEYGDCYSDTDEAKFGKHITRLTGFIISIPAAVMWWCTPLIVAGLMIYDKIQEKNPELCGFKADDFDKEENK